MFFGFASPASCGMQYMRFDYLVKFFRIFRNRWMISDDWSESGGSFKLIYIKYNRRRLQSSVRGREGALRSLVWDVETNNQLFLISSTINIFLQTSWNFYLSLIPIFLIYLQIFIPECEMDRHFSIQNSDRHFRKYKFFRRKWWTGEIARWKWQEFTRSHYGVRLLHSIWSRGKQQNLARTRITGRKIWTKMKSTGEKCHAQCSWLYLRMTKVLFIYELCCNQCLPGMLITTLTDDNHLAMVIGCKFAIWDISGIIHSRS